MENLTIVYENLPFSISGFTMHNAEDDYYTVVLNSRMSYMTNCQTFRHELAHISNDDFIRYKDVSFIEHNTHEV